MSLVHPLVSAVLLASVFGGGGEGQDSGIAISGPQGSALAVKRPGASIASVVLPPLTVATIGTPTHVDFELKDSSGKTVIGVEPKWTTGDALIARISPLGQLTPIRAGVTTLTAAVGGVSGSTTVTVRGVVPIPSRSRIVGVNLGGVAYWTTQFPLVDLMKTSGGWGSVEDNGTRGAPFPTMTADGYPAALKPGQHAVSFVSSSGTHRAIGQYVVLWDGDGTVSFPLSNVTIAKTAARRIAIDVSAATDELWVSIDATSASNPVHNLRFLVPGTEATYATQPFGTAFLQKIAPFSTLRFMDWSGTNNSPIAAWSDRALPGDVTYTTAKGVPVESMIELANTLHVDPWFCVPHQASDDYVTRFATLLHDKLDPTLHPHIEYSNEMWNTGNAQTGWALAQSSALHLPRPHGQPSAFYATRAVQIFGLVRSAFGADASRVVRVLAGQAAWTQFLESALAWNHSAASADVMAIAPYFTAAAASDVNQVAKTLTLTSDQVVDQLLASVRGDVTRSIGANAALARRYGLKLQAYEAGPGDSAAYFPADKIDAVTALFASANRNPRMHDLYLEFYGIWEQAGGDTMNQYNDIGAWSKWGFWGALEFVAQNPKDAPKYRALVDYIHSHPTP